MPRNVWLGLIIVVAVAALVWLLLIKLNMSTAFLLEQKIPTT